MKKQAAEYAKASKTIKGVMLDQLVATTGWSRANARRALTAAVKWKGTAKAVKRKPRWPTYGYDTLKLLIQVWKLSGRPSGKYLAATMGMGLPKLEEHHELDEGRLTEHTRAQLLAVSGTTIGRMFKSTRVDGRLVGFSGTKPGPLLRNSIQVRKAGDEHRHAPGRVEADLALHCGAILQGMFVHPCYYREQRPRNGADTIQTRARTPPSRANGSSRCSQLASWSSLVASLSPP